ncbi:MAG TPA: hypothetical protein DD766_02460 [Desulfovibrio sp.]|nr:hypothetical protein [Desulfovibrio sp.]
MSACRRRPAGARPGPLPGPGVRPRPCGWLRPGPRPRPAGACPGSGGRTGPRSAPGPRAGPRAAVPRPRPGG